MEDTRRDAAQDADRLEAFIARWQKVTGSERANDHLFITELCGLLGVPAPEPADDHSLAEQIKGVTEVLSSSPRPPSSKSSKPWAAPAARRPLPVGQESWQAA